jgi:hypothetical protein
VDKNEALKLALEALQDYVDEYGPWSDDSGAQYVLRVGKEALAQPEPVQVSPLDFVTMTLEKEHLVGRPVIWAQWPNEEKNYV